MKLIVEKFPLLGGSPYVSELPAASCVSDGTLSGSLKHVNGAIGDCDSSLHHDLVNHSRVADHLKISLTINLSESSEHC